MSELEQLKAENALLQKRLYRTRNELRQAQKLNASLHQECRGHKRAVYLLEGELKAERDAIAERARRRAMN